MTLMATYPAPGCLTKLSKEVVIAIGGRLGLVKERNTIVGGLCSNELVNSNRQKYPLGNFFFWNTQWVFRFFLVFFCSGFTRLG